MSTAEAQTAGQALMVIPVPTVIDAAGNSVPASLSVLADKITLSVKPASGTTYPVIADLTIAAPSNKVSAERDPVRYGLADDTPGTFAKEENGKLVEEKGKPVDDFDPNLQKAEAPLHVTTARMVIPYDVFFTPTSTEAEKFKNWLSAVKVAGLQPYVTLGPDTSAGCALKHDECYVPSLTSYRAGIRDLIHNEPGVKLWGSWNEPDILHYPMREHEHLAAEYWQVAQYVASHNCSGCKVIAGEFAFENEYHGHYISEYKKTIVEQHKYPPCKFCSGAKPSIWGFHDYHDVVHSTSAFAEKFTKFVGGRLGKAQIWISEAGVELQSGGPVPTELAKIGSTQKEQEEKQTKAAEDFEKLHEVSTRIERIYYYGYRAPTEQKQEQGEHEKPVVKLPFDSSLFEAEPEGKGKSKGEARAAYCVLAFADHSCEPTVVDGPGASAVVDPNGRATTVHFDWHYTVLHEEASGELQEIDEHGETTPVSIGSGLFGEVVPALVPRCAPTFYRGVASNNDGTTEGTEVELPLDCFG